MFSGIGVVCFVGSYAVAFLLEWVRLVRPSAALRLSVLAALSAGVAAHSVYLAHHFILRNDHLVVNAAGWFFLLAWGLALLCLYLYFDYPKTPFGLFLLPIIFLVIGSGVVLAQIEFPVAATGRTIRAVHVVALLTTAVTVFYGFVTGVMYFLQLAKLRRRIVLPVGLPSLEWLRRANRRAVKGALIPLGVGVLSGFYILHIQNFDSLGALYFPFSDFMILGALFLFALLLFAALPRNRSAQTDGRVALLTIICFALLTLILAAGVLCPHAHWRRGDVPPAVNAVSAVSVSCADERSRI